MIRITGELGAGVWNGEEISGEGANLGDKARGGWGAEHVDADSDDNGAVEALCDRECDRAEVRRALRLLFELPGPSLAEGAIAGSPDAIQFRFSEGKASPWTTSADWPGQDHQV